MQEKKLGKNASWLHFFLGLGMFQATKTQTNTTCNVGLSSFNGEIVANMSRDSCPAGKYHRGSRHTVY